MDIIRSVVGAAAALVVVAGCSEHPAPTPGATRSLGTGDQRSAYLQFARCMRTNGQPTFPDPIQDASGEWGFPASIGKAVAPAACEAAYRQLRSVNQGIAEQGSHVDMATLRDFSTCMREHGLSDWPDPTADGLFPLPGRYAPPDGNRLIAAPLRACPQGAGVKIQLPRYNAPAKS
jgi:hypothetical protein